LTQLYPLGKDEKRLGFQKVLRIVLYGLLGIEVSLALLFSKESIMVVLLLLVGIFLHEGYLPAKLKKLID